MKNLTFTPWPWFDENTGNGSLSISLYFSISRGELLIQPVQPEIQINLSLGITVVVEVENDKVVGRGVDVGVVQGRPVHVLFFREQ